MGHRLGAILRFRLNPGVYEYTDTREKIDGDKFMPVFELVLYPTYYSKGFFNVTRNFSSFVRSDDGPISIMLGDGELVFGRAGRPFLRQ